MPPGHEKDVYNYFRRYMNSEEDYQTLIDEFWDFRLKENVFHHTWICWEHQGIPYKFWRNVATHTKMIGTFASRLFSAPANSVASERAFSTQNLIHTKSRNHLLSDHVNKLMFIYMNGWVFHAMDSGLMERIVKVKTFAQLMSVEELELENEILGVEEEFGETLDDDSEEEGVDGLDFESDYSMEDF